MLRKHDIPGTHYEQVRIPAAAADAASAVVGTWAAPFKCTVVSAEFVPTADVAGTDSDSRNLNLQLADGTEIGHVDFASGTDATAATPKALTLTGTAAQRTLNAGAGLLVQSELVGTNGLALPIGNIRIGFRGA